jgi:hypothetical protein
VRVSALSAHPYSGRKNYPTDEQNGDRIDALGQKDTSGFVPTYTADFPEYFGTLLQTESVLRDMGPIPTSIGNTLHGRNARVVQNTIVPCPMWFTEIGFAPKENGIVEPAAALAIKAKTTDRYECFYINKGLERLYFFSALSGDNDLGVVQENFVRYARTHTDYPTDDTPYVSPMLRTIRRLVEVMKTDVDPTLTRTRAITIKAIRDTHNHFQFQGNGAPAHPTLYNHDVFAILPFQVNAHKFIIPYYVMSRDVFKPFVPETYTVSLAGIQGKKATLRAYDPLRDKSVPLRASTASNNNLIVTLTATDYPILLIVQEHP